MTWRWRLFMTITLADIFTTEGDRSTPGYKRLPQEVRPSHYNLFLAYSLDPEQKFPFYGLAKIKLSTNALTTSEIILHAENLNIAKNKVEVHHDSGDKLEVVNIQLEPEDHYLKVRLQQPLAMKQSYELVIPFWGNLQTGLLGAYVSSYKITSESQKEYLVVTQFEPVEARKAFPCFDEPALKANFSIHLAHHRDYSAISNMPVINQKNDDLMAPYWTWNTMAQRFGSSGNEIKESWIWESFSESVPMSTYLVAWVISKFEYVTSPKGLSHVNFRTWARKDALSQATYASTVGPKALTFYEDWFDIPFPLPKQDMVAIPDFSSGAMENWGMVTFRETGILFDPEKSSITSKEQIAGAVAHELAHQWFGNLVTMEWWSDLWLNEGFATYMSILGVDAVECSWNYSTSTVSEYFRDVLTMDALRSSHPLSVPLHDPKMVNEIFDIIAYKKGAMLIHMMYKILGKNVFRKGINRYLVSHSYGNAEQANLLSALSAAAMAEKVLLPSGTNAANIMNTWTLQTGYPLITVTRDYSSKTLQVTQHRFLNLDQHSHEAWWVPLTIFTEASLNQQFSPVTWLAPTEGIKEPKRFSHNAAPSQWILLNIDMVALYRVSYDDNNWALLVAALADPKTYHQIPVLSRVQLLDNSFAFAKISQLPYSTTLSLASYLRHESEYVALDAGLSNLGFINHILSRDKSYSIVQAYLRNLIAPRYIVAGGLTKQMQSHTSQKLQLLVNSWACHIEARNCVDSALLLFSKWMRSPNSNPIPSDVRYVVYCTAMKRGNVSHWNFLNEQRSKTNLASEHLDMLKALSCSYDTNILRRYLERIVTNQSDIRTQDVISILSTMASNPKAFAVVNEFVFTRIEDLLRRFFVEKQHLGDIVKALLMQYNTQSELDQFLKWRQKNAHHLEYSRMTIERAIERIKIRVKWMTEHRDDVLRIMKQQSSLIPNYHSLNIFELKNYKNLKNSGIKIHPI